MGGSQGSHRINTEFLQTIRVLKEQLDFQVIHISGPKDYSELQSQYTGCGVRFCLFEFLEEIAAAYQAADLVIARSGSGTVLEIAKFRLPAVLIPYPHAGGHQKQNAKILGQANVATIIEEKDLTVKTLKNTIIDLCTHRPTREEFRHRVKDLVIADAADRLADEIVMLAKADKAG